MAGEARTILALPGPVHAIPPADAARGTLIASSMAAMRSHGLQDQYYAALPPEVHDAIRNLNVRSWVPLDLVMHHYRAMDALGYSRDQARLNGRVVADRIQQSYIGTIVRSLKASGALSVWALFERLQSAWDRIVRGGAASVVALGPKEARIGCYGVPMAQFQYFRAGWEGMFDSAAELVCRKAYVREIPRETTNDSIVYRASWA